ncbi:ComEC/Rec2 family competence protein [Halomonas sp. V046]|uniref:ComEC/Rec2 family competence protein n=1 Tax=Halomonas sp. V046 TaxID=3459611 RepID=UPI0040442895
MTRPSATALLFLLGVLALGVTAPAAKGDLRILHFDVGMGDAALIFDTDSRRSLLIDAGNRGYGRRVVAPALQALGIERLSYFLASHYDADHIGGFDELVEAGIGVDVVLEREGELRPDVRTPTGRLSQYGEYLKAAEAAGAVPASLAPGCGTDKAIDLGQRTLVEVVASGGGYLVSEQGGCTIRRHAIGDDEENALSVALVVTHGAFRYFTGGDLTGGGQRTPPMESLVAPWVGDIDVLRLNHHGSTTSTSEVFIRALRPEVAILSVGDGGVNLRYRLPRQVTLDRLAALLPAPLLFQTHRGEGGLYTGAYIENRHIAIHTDGVSYTINGLICLVDERITMAGGGNCQ